MRRERKKIQFNSCGKSSVRTSMESLRRTTVNQYPSHGEGRGPRSSAGLQLTWQVQSDHYHKFRSQESHKVRCHAATKTDPARRASDRSTFGSGSKMLAACRHHRKLLPTELEYQVRHTFQSVMDITVHTCLSGLPDFVLDSEIWIKATVYDVVATTECPKYSPYSPELFRIAMGSTNECDCRVQTKQTAAVKTRHYIHELQHTLH